MELQEYNKKTFKANQKLIFEALKQNILMSESDIHKDMLNEDGQSEYTIKDINDHSDIMEQINNTKQLSELLVIMDKDFGMDLDELYNIYM